MSAANAFSQRPSQEPFDDDASEGWSLPIVRLGRTRIHLSYSVFVALAVLIAFTLSVATREGNEDLPLVTMMGVGFWVAGWMVQLFSSWAICHWMRRPCTSLTIGLWGTESTRRIWSAGQCLTFVLATLAPVLVLAVVLLFADRWLYGPSAVTTTWLFGWLPTLQAPSLGLTKADSILQSGAWLLFIQLLCQTLPFPTTLGRLGLIATVALTEPDSNTEVQARRVQLSIHVIAFTMALTAIVLLWMDDRFMHIQWPLLLILAVVLWITASSPDIRDCVNGFNQLSDAQVLQWLEADGEPSTEDAAAGKHRRRDHSVISLAALRGVARTWQHRRKAKRAMIRERAEADDVKHLDEVLERLHRDGHESLSDKDRALLLRVSRTLRQHRKDSSAGR